MNKGWFIIFIFISSHSFSQELITDINGFRLGQYRDVPKNELSAILRQDKFDDGYEYEIYLVEPDTSVYMIFEYANYDLESIWSIQITGKKVGFDCGFKELKLGMSESEIETIIGKPTEIKSAGDYGSRWSYDSTNYSLEINPNGKLGGVKIIDQSREFYPTPDLKKLPNFAEYSDIINSNNRRFIANLMAPGMELYKNDSVFYFQNSMENEIEEDISGIFNLTRELSEKLRKVNSQDTLQYEENLRLTLGQDPLHVAKIKVDGEYSEIVFKYHFGKYLIWEVRL